ncbi:membrane-associated protein, putative [Bodo saltans]|uniref:Membrane-associated protein, putative n=1 Tax=Bodo saltans TaxID=75058 RepID=A0A0S4IX39_BODSA|nr:membrane-associated protein, putative [Bodo saltans]|eukprot:CUG35908.1 membrane-associated protein, putative [Bodo saltans]
MAKSTDCYDYSLPHLNSSPQVLIVLFMLTALPLLNQECKSRHNNIDFAFSGNLLHTKRIFIHLLAVGGSSSRRGFLLKEIEHAQSQLCSHESVWHTSSISN